eukprot:SAG11_NODE_4143_length_2042_cov_1.680391_2_plen_300_part_00
MLKKQQRAADSEERFGDHDGAMTGPTISSCTLEAGELELKFNASLLGGEGLMLRPFDANTSNWAPEPGWAGPGPIHDSLGLMVCAANGSALPGGAPGGGNAGIYGNATTCECQGWNYFKYNGSDPSNPGAWWYCEVGPGYKPPPATIARERRERQLLTAARKRQAEQLIRGEMWSEQEESELIARVGVGTSWVPEANVFQHQWQTATLKPSSGGTNELVVDLSNLAGQTPLAIRLAWTLFDAPDQSADTCCPSAMVQQGKAVCLPGNCPLYSNVSELAANPFFAKIVGGKCVCMAPQVC